MKSVFNNQAWRRMAGLSAFLYLSGLILVPFAAGGAQTTWDSQDYGSLFTTPPVIDATNFINRGTWYIGVFPYPYRTSDTLNYTNKGYMDASLGWAFDLGPAGSGSTSNLRKASGIFFNDNNGVIESDDYTYDGLAYVSYLWVSATNIVNQGTLQAGTSGQILLRGTTNGTVNLSRSLVEITPTTSSSSGSDPFIYSATNIVPAHGFTYLFWAQTNMNIDTTTLWDGTSFRVPKFVVGASCNQTNLLEPSGPFSLETNFIATANLTFYITNQSGFITASNAFGDPVNSGVATNYIHEVVFIIPPNNPAANVRGDVRFTPSLNPTNVFDNVAVQLLQINTNLVTLLLQTNAFYLADFLASTTNLGLFLAPANPASGCSDPTRQPISFVVSRSDPYLPNIYSPTYQDLGNGYAFASGLHGTTGLPPTNFLYDSTWTNTVIPVEYADLDTTINNITTPLPPGGSVTNAGGRVQIYAGNLNLGLARMGGESWIGIQGKHLVDSVGAVVDCQNLSYDLGSTNGTLVFTNLALSTVNRFQGNVHAWSATWSNLTTVSFSTFIVTTNYEYQTNLTTLALEYMHVLVVDASQLGEPVPVNVLDLHLHAATNIVIGDPVNVNDSFFIDGPGLTLQKRFSLTSGVQNWTWNNAPILRYFTNNVYLSVPNSAHFGDDGPTNYLSFINNGTIYAGGQTIDSVNLQINNGNNQAIYSDFTAITQTGQLAGATINANGAINFSANSLQINNSTLVAYDAINFTVTGSLSDGGQASGNSFYCDNGFNLWTQPTNVASGDLLGTIINDRALGQANVFHNWAGQDSGANAAGFTDHTAIGELVLSQASNVQKPKFSFYGTNTTSTNGLYVNLLDLSSLTDYTNELYINPNLIIYYAHANLNPSVNTGSLTPEQFLNGQFGGHLLWVPVSIPLPLSAGNALSQRFQLAANYSAASKSIQLTTGILPAQTNIIEASTDLLHWVPIYTNIGSFTNVGVSIISDSSTSNYPYRFYRAVPMP
jgi:hypothetical protein